MQYSAKQDFPLLELQCLCTSECKGVTLEVMIMYTTPGHALTQGSCAVAVRTYISGCYSSQKSTACLSSFSNAHYAACPSHLHMDGSTLSIDQAKQDVSPIEPA